MKERVVVGVVARGDGGKRATRQDRKVWVDRVVTCIHQRHGDRNKCQVDHGGIIGVVSCLPICLLRLYWVTVQLQLCAGKSCDRDLRPFSAKVHQHPAVIPTSHNGEESSSQRSNSEINSGSRAGLAFATRRPCSGKQRCQEHGFLQGTTALGVPWPAPESRTLTLRIGIQRKNSAICGRYSHPCTHHRPSRPLLPLLAAHPANRNITPQRCWRLADKEQDSRCRQCAWADE